jgi:hypothetical protein
LALGVTALKSPHEPRGTVGFVPRRGVLSTGVDGWQTGARPQDVRLSKEHDMGVGTLVLIVLILVLLGVFPTWPHSRSWGYGPSGAVGVIVVVLLILLLMGRLQ